MKKCFFLNTIYESQVKNKLLGGKQIFNVPCDATQTTIKSHQRALVTFVTVKAIY